MNPSQSSPPGITQDLIELLADAKRGLPPTEGRDQEAFYQRALGSLLEAFWERYMSSLPPAAFDAFVAATKTSGYEAIGQWQQRYADFEGDDQARSIAQRVLSELGQRVPDMLRSDFEEASLPIGISRKAKDLPSSLGNAA